MAMLTIYINYPNSYITVHRNRCCNCIQSHQKANQRVVTIDKANLDSELDKFKTKKYRFASTSQNNDMWVHVDLGDEIHERAAVEGIRELLAQHYTPFADISVDTHC
jgi:hypothetical protein